MVVGGPGFPLSDHGSLVVLLRFAPAGADLPRHEPRPRVRHPHRAAADLVGNRRLALPHVIRRAFRARLERHARRGHGRPQPERGLRGRRRFAPRLHLGHRPNVLGRDRRLPRLDRPPALRLLPAADRQQRHDAAGRRALRVQQLVRRLRQHRPDHRRDLLPRRVHLRVRRFRVGHPRELPADAGRHFRVGDQARVHLHAAPPHLAAGLPVRVRGAARIGRQGPRPPGARRRRQRVRHEGTTPSTRSAFTTPGSCSAWTSPTW